MGRFDGCMFRLVISRVTSKSDMSSKEENKFGFQAGVSGTSWSGEALDLRPRPSSECMDSAVHSVLVLK